MSDDKRQGSILITQSKKLFQHFSYFNNLNRLELVILSMIRDDILSSLMFQLLRQAQSQYLGPSSGLEIGNWSGNGRYTYGVVLTARYIYHFHDRSEHKSLYHMRNNIMFVSSHNIMFVSSHNMKGASVVQLVARWTTDHYHLSSNLGIGIYLKGVSSLTSLHYCWKSLSPFSLPCAQKWA